MAGRVVAAAGDRLKVAGDILAFPYFFQPDEELTFDEKAAEKHLRGHNGAAVPAAGAGETPAPRPADLLAKFRDRLASAEPFDAATLEQLMHDFVAAEGIKIAQIIHPVRVALTGQSIGLGLFDTLAILGKERCLRRIERALGRR